MATAITTAICACRTDNRRLNGIDEGAGGILSTTVVSSLTVQELKSESQKHSDQNNKVRIFAIMKVVLVLSYFRRGILIQPIPNDDLEVIFDRFCVE